MTSKNQKIEDLIFLQAIVKYGHLPLTLTQVQKDRLFDLVISLSDKRVLKGKIRKELDKL